MSQVRLQDLNQQEPSVTDRIGGLGTPLVASREHEVSGVSVVLSVNPGLGGILLRQSLLHT